MTRSELISQDIEEKKQNIEAFRELRKSADSLRERIIQALGDGRARDKICLGMQKKLQKDKECFEAEKAEKEKKRREVLDN